MNKITINGILREGGEKYDPGTVYYLDVTRKSGTVDSLLVLDPEGNRPIGAVTVTGKIKSQYIHGVGVPAFIVPDRIDAIDENELNGQSEAVITGVLKTAPKCREIQNSKIVASFLLKTDDGVIPAILWGSNAVKAEKRYKIGDRVKLTGRMQSREYPDKDGTRRTTYELSGSRIEPFTEE